MPKVNFILPVKFGRLIHQENKTYIIEPDRGFDWIIAPYDGQIMEYSDIEVDGYTGFLRLSHYINGKMYYSEIRGFGGINGLPPRRTNITKKQELTKIGNSKEIKYQIKDENKNKLDIALFFGGSIGDDEKKDNKSNNKTSSDKGSDDKDTSSNDYGSKYKPKIDKVPDLFTPLLLAPIDFVHNALTDFPKKGKKETSEEEELNEEIKRIRQLLK
jgi:hypothetical protein